MPPALGAWLIGEVTAAAVQALILDITPGQRHTVRTILSQAFSYARLDGAITSDPVSDTVVPAPEERHEPDVQTAEQVRSLREAVRSWGSTRRYDPRKVTPHTLRRTLATFLSREIGTREAADQLGHTDPAVTLSHYIAPEHRGPDARAANSSFIQGPSAGNELGRK